MSKLKCWQSHAYLFHDIHNNNFPGMIQTQHFLVQGHSSHTWLMWSVILDLDIFKTRYQCEWYCIFIKKRCTIFNHTMLSSSTSSSSLSFINIMHRNYYHYKGIMFYSYFLLSSFDSLCNSIYDAQSKIVMKEKWYSRTLNLHFFF